VLINRQIFGTFAAGQVIFIAVGGKFAQTFVGFECPIRSLTGWQCPGCGSTKCVSALGAGELVSGFLYNPFLSTAIGISLFIALFGVVFPISANRALSRIVDRQKWVILSFLFVMGAFTVGRNL